MFFVPVRHTGWTNSALTARAGSSFLEDRVDCGLGTFFAVGAVFGVAREAAGWDRAFARRRCGAGVFRVHLEDRPVVNETIVGGIIRPPVPSPTATVVQNERLRSK